MGRDVGADPEVRAPWRASQGGQRVHSPETSHPHGAVTAPAPGHSKKRSRQRENREEEEENACLGFTQAVNSPGLSQQG